MKLFSFGANFGLADPSPFVLKVDTYLRMAGITFDSVADMSNLQRAPKGKLPYIEDNGQQIADSFFILQYLKANYPCLDTHLTHEQKAITQLVTKSLDENLYWCIVYSRWLCNDSWPAVKQAFFGALPFPLKYIIPFIARRSVSSAFNKHGMGKHSDEEIMAIAQDSLESLSLLLADKPYFWGEQPSSLDASVYAFVAQLTLSTLDNPLNTQAKQFKNLHAFCERVTKTYY